VLAEVELFLIQLLLDLAHQVVPQLDIGFT
jgi:hypothetical protein